MVQAWSRASAIRWAEWNPGGKMGHFQIEGESFATHRAAANSAGKTFTGSGGLPPETRAWATFARANK